MVLERGICYSPDGAGGGAIRKDAPIPPREIEIGTSQYLLSAEAQQYLRTEIVPEGQHSRSVVIIYEPHQSVSGQFDLYKGLEVFFHDNPELVKRTVFLAEGYPADETLSVQPLIDIDPNPSDDIIREALRTFLIPGYLAYEWKHQQGIPIVGVEDPWLYKLCRTLLMQHERNPDTSYGLQYQGIEIPIMDWWQFSVIARNKSMAQTLMRHMNQFENPILFVGGLHLYKFNDEEFEFLKRWGPAAGIAGPFSIFRGDVNRSENIGLDDYLSKHGIAFTFLHSEVGELTLDERGYIELLKAQHGNDYFPLYLDDDNEPDYETYVRWLLEQKGTYPETTTPLSPIKLSITIRPSPKAVSKYIYERTEQRRSESSNWFSIGRNEVQKKLGRGTIWDKPPVARGRSYERLRGASIGGNYPIVDDINDYAATSMKTLDLTTGPYQDPNVLGSTVRGYIDSLSGFSGPQHKYLELGIPAGRATPSHVDTLCELQNYAGGRGITLAIGEVP